MVMSTCEVFRKKLATYTRVRCELVINENRSTMLSVLDRRPGFARLSVHKMFLSAPDPVIAAVAHFIKGARRQREEHNFVLRTFIQQQLSQADYTYLVNPQKLVQEGRVYHLKMLYDSINQKYFENQLRLAITWYGNLKRRARTRITFGQYLDGLRLIKIHRILDDPFFPEYFVAFIVYHEMLHAVIPGHANETSRRYTFHSREFKAREREFEHYHLALAWEKRNKELLFRYNYGWT